MMWPDAARGAYRHRPTGRPAGVPVRRFRTRAGRLQGARDAKRRLPATLESNAARVGTGGGRKAGPDVLTGARRLPALPIATGALERDSGGPLSGRRVRESLSRDGALAAIWGSLRGGGLHRRARWVVCDLAVRATGSAGGGLDRSLPRAHGPPWDPVRVHFREPP